MYRQVSIAQISLFAASSLLAAASASAQQSDSVGQGRQLAHAQCAQCHEVESQRYPTETEAPPFEHIANVPGMTSAALTVALRTSHRSMPDFIIEDRDARNIIAYMLSLKKERD